MTPTVASNWENCKLNLTEDLKILWIQPHVLLHSIVVTVSLLAEQLGCYKMSLDCKDKLIKFYETLGYVLIPGNSNSMTIRYDEDPTALKRNLTSSSAAMHSGDACQTVSLDFAS